MASDDAQRTWYPEMIGWLRSQWHREVSMPTPLSLRDELDGILQQIRS